MQANDTVYSIAFRNGIDWRDLARWNGIDGPRYLIRVGDELRLTPPRGDVQRASEAAPAAPVPRAAPPPVVGIGDVRFAWPTDGELIARFDDPHAIGKGIAIAGRGGQPIVAAAPGRVVYVGSGLIGYGRLIIVKHSNQVLSAYAHNREILAREGDEVSAGQRIAIMGEGPGRRTMLHFEIRVDGRAVDPLQYLPPR